VRERRHRLGLAIEAGEHRRIGCEFGLEQLDRHPGVLLLVFGAVHRADAALTERDLDAVARPDERSDA